MRTLTAIALSLLIGFGAAQAEPATTIGAIEIVAPFARASLPKSRTGGAFLTIVNTGTEDDRLVSASSPDAENVQLHETSIENNVASMRELTDGVVIPAGGSVVLEPSGMHLMLTRLAAPLVEGGRLALTLNFERAGAVSIDMPIGSIAARAAPK